MIHDPLLQYEQTTHTCAKKTKYTSRILRAIKFLSLYLVFTGGIFALLM